jgi:hypothetical protein
MESHSSAIIEFDKQKTEKGYDHFNTVICFPNETWKKCLALIKEMSLRQNLDIGIDFFKPWEEIKMKYYYQIEYLFVGKLFNKKDYYINDLLVGINIFKENRFGQKQFDSDNILNLTLIINKDKIN